MSEQLAVLKSYLEGGDDNKGSHFVKEVYTGQPARTLGEAVLRPRESPSGQPPKLVVVPLLDSDDVAYAWDKSQEA
jgi:hypothetical protein